MNAQKDQKNTVTEQARVIYDTVRMLKTRIIAEHMAYVNSHASAAGGLELTIPQMNMLSVIRDTQPITLKQLAAALHVSAPSASAMVDRLVEMNAVTREQNPADRREVVISITEHAGAELCDMEDHMLQSIAALIERIGPDYAEKWCEVYARLREILAAEVGGDSWTTPEGSAGA